MFSKKSDTEMMEKEQAVVNVTPGCDIRETADGVEVEIEVPGCTREGVSLTVERNTLSINAHADAALVAGIWSEPGEALQYQRSFRIGRDLDQEKISAKVENGVLIVALPRKESEKPRRIDVQ